MVVSERGVLLPVALGALALAAATAGQVDASVSRAVPLWGRFETEVANGRAYANPFADVVLNSVFTAPSGRRVVFIGYYDGDGQGHQDGHVWRLRFMPDEPGQWSYTSAFSDGTPGAAGSFRCTRSGALPGPLRRDATNHAALAFADGSHFYPRCYYLSEAFTGPSPLWEDLLDGFFGGTYHYNLNCTTFWQGRLLEHNHWNNLPYTGFYPTFAGDYTRLDVAAWRHVDEVVQRMEARRTVWYNFDGFVPNVGGDMGDRRTDFAAQSVYVRNAVARLAPYWNVVWNIAFEWSEFLSPEQVARLADYTRSLDPWGHLIAVHDQGPYQTGADVLANLHVDMVTLQYQAGTAPSAEAANHMVRQFAGDWPVFGQEMAWEATPGKLSGDQVRRASWGIVLGGGFPCYAEMFQGPDWGTPANYGNGVALPFLEILHDFIGGLPYYAMTSHNELVEPGCLCLAQPGKRYVCYTEAGGTISLDLAAASGGFACEWLDPRTGEKRPADSVSGGGLRAFQAPDAEDWVLLVTTGAGTDHGTASGQP